MKRIWLMSSSILLCILYLLSFNTSLSSQFQAAEAQELVYRYNMTAEVTAEIRKDTNKKEEVHYRSFNFLFPLVPFIALLHLIYRKEEKGFVRIEKEVSIHTVSIPALGANAPPVSVY